METLHVLETHDLKRLDVVLADHEKVSSRAEAQRIIKSGQLRINQSDQNITQKRKVKAGDIVEFSVSPPVELQLVATPGNLNIIFEDDHLIIINKKKGVVVHPSAGHFDDTLVNYLLHHTNLPDNDPIRPGIVHRIDKDTSGLLVVAKNIKTHESLAKQFFHHTISRKYIAICWGEPKTNSGTINQPLGRHPSDRKKFAVREQGKKSITHWRLLKGFKYLCLLECELETGRTHQIRVHLNSLGHSLLGDPIYGRFRNYGKKIPEAPTLLLKQFEGQALHAKSIGFHHPESGDWMEFDSQIPDEFNQVIAALEQL